MRDDAVALVEELNAELRSDKVTRRKAALKQLETHLAPEGPVVGVFPAAGELLNALRAESVCADEPWDHKRGQAFHVLDPPVVARLERRLA